jgi:hypothetical protein
MLMNIEKIKERTRILRPALLGRTFGLSDWNHIHYATTASTTEFDGTCSQSEEGVVFATTDVGAGVEMGTTLANQDLATVHYLTAEALNSQILRV